MMRSRTVSWNGTGEREFARREVGERAESASEHAGLARLVLLAVAFLLPLTVVPGWQHPFSLPKLILWGIVIVGGLVLCRRDLRKAWQGLPQALQIGLTLWLAALGASAALGESSSLESLLTLLAGPAWLVLIVAVHPRADRLAWALVLSGICVAAIAVAQILHADPFGVVGWIPGSAGSARMRVFATLGNPDFVAAFLSGLVPLTFSLAICIRERRGLLISLLSLQTAAILCTGSRAPILALIAASLWMVLLRRHRSWLGLVVVGSVVVVMTTAFSPARDLPSTLRGRAYIWKVSSPHLAEHPVLGLGPGGFGAAFAAWETQYWQKTPDEQNRKFAGLEDHAHNDYLEIFTDHGILGLAAFTTLLTAFLRAAWRGARDNPLAAGASAGVIALASVSLVDFPLMRPTETFLFWSLMAVSLLSSGKGSRPLRESRPALKGE